MILMIIPVMRCGVFVLFCMIILCMPVDFTGAVMFVMFALVFKQGPFAKS